MLGKDSGSGWITYDSATTEGRKGAYIGIVSLLIATVTGGFVTVRGDVSGFVTHVALLVFAKLCYGLAISGGVVAPTVAFAIVVSAR